jgi:hypothetical protein
MKTNSKEFERRMQEYILSCIDTEAYEKTFETTKERLAFVHDCFVREFWYDNNKKRYGSQERGFAEYLMGLPSVIGVDFENYKILELAKSMGTYKDTQGMTKGAIERYEDTIISNWFPIVSCNFFKMLHKENVSIN